MKPMIIVFYMWSSVYSHSLQNAIDYDSLSRVKSKQLVEKYFGESLQKLDYLLFSVADDRYLIIVERKNSFDEYFFNEDTLHHNKKYRRFLSIRKSNKILKKAFNESLYRKEFITMKSDFFKNKHPFFAGLGTYFYLSKSGTKFGEESLTLFVNPNPMDKTVYKYLFTSFTKFSKP
jgi:hypothetical protein